MINILRRRGWRGDIWIMIQLVFVRTTTSSWDIDKVASEELG
jgi:hypothetical protein